MSNLERGRFDRMTRWLDGLTIHDLSAVDASGVELIDDWIDLLDRTTEIRVQHTSGTTGKLSFVPRSETEGQRTLQYMSGVVRHWFGRDSGPELRGSGRPLVAPGYRYGAAATQRGYRRMTTLWAGSEDNALFMYPNSRLSADVASLSGRLRVAEAQGEIGSLQLSPALLRSRAQYAELERNRPLEMKRFFEEATQRFGGCNITLFAVWPILFECAEEGLARGLRGVFGRDSVLISGGGAKGRKLPADWREQIECFLGFSRAYEMYGTSEWMSICWRCESGNYHLPPTLVPFMLDPKSGALLPRRDGVTGRFAAFDLMLDTYWSGLVTGDEVTMGGWQDPCTCGRRSSFILPTIRRYGEHEGGDDRVVCSGAPEAHDRASEFLATLAE
jgi:hypothetical protein